MRAPFVKSVVGRVSGDWLGRAPVERLAAVPGSPWDWPDSVAGGSVPPPACIPRRDEESRFTWVHQPGVSNLFLFGGLWETTQYTDPPILRTTPTSVNLPLTDVHCQ